MFSQGLKIVILLSFGLLVVACGKNPFEKDPMADQEEHVRKAEPGVRKPELVWDDSKAVINAENGASFFAFSEGVESQATIEAAVLVEGYNWEVFIENQDDFKDSTFVQNGKSWIFTWKPPLNIVPSSAPLSLPLRVVIAATEKNGRVVRSKHRDFHVFVTANRGAPVFVRDESFPSGSIREGESRQFYVYVRDTDPIGSTPVAPRLRFEAGSASTFGSTDISGYLSVGRVTQERDPAIWKFQINIDLSRAELTKSTTKGTFRIRAASRTNIQSLERDYSVDLITSVAQPISDFYSGEMLTVARGAKLTKIITFTDPNAEGRVSAINETMTLPAGLEVKCETNRNFAHLATCTLTWDVPATTVPAQYGLTLKAENKSPVSTDNRRADSKIIVKIEVTP